MPGKAPGEDDDAWPVYQRAGQLGLHVATALLRSRCRCATTGAVDEDVLAHLVGVGVLGQVGGLASTTARKCPRRQSSAVNQPRDVAVAEVLMALNLGL